MKKISFIYFDLIKSLALYLGLLLLFKSSKDVLSQNRGKSIIATLESQWRDTSLIHEAGEFFNEENEAFFWNYIEKTNKYYLLKTDDQDRILKLTSEKSEYDNLLEIAESLYDNDDKITWIKYMKFALSLRIYSPKLEMFNQIHKEDYQQFAGEFSKLQCPNHLYIRYSNKIYCNINDFINAAGPVLKRQAGVDDIQPHIYPSVDHRYPTYQNYSSPLPIVILYSDIRTKHFADSHQKLKSLAVQHLLQYYYRPTTPRHNGDPQRATRKTYLSGYGVELAIKNTEYKARDDDKINDTNGMEHHDTHEAHDEDGEIVQGLNFSRLKELHPGLEDDLSKFRDQLVQNGSDLRILKAWELNEISFRAAQLIAKAESLEDKLKVLRDLSQNYPTKAPSILATSCEADLKKEIAKNQMDTFQSQLHLPDGDSAFFLNRLPVETAHFNIFELFQTLRKEIRPMKILHSYDIQGPDMYDVLSTRLELKEEEIALDFTSEAIKYINNLEKDDEYKSWSPSLSVMEQTFWFGMVTEIRKNLFNVILVVDPTDLNVSLPFLKLVQKFHKSRQPFHMGLVLVNPETSRPSEGESTSDGADPRSSHSNNDSDRESINLLYAAYNYSYANGVKKVDGLDTLVQILELLSHATAGSDHVTDASRGAQAALGDFGTVSEAVCTVLSKKYGLSDADCRKLSTNPKYADGVYDGREFYETSGLGTMPQILFNGIPLTKQQIDPSLLEKELNNMVLKNYYTFYEAYFNGKINDRVDIVSYLNKRSNVLPRINKDILSLSGPYLDFREPSSPKQKRGDVKKDAKENYYKSPDDVDTLPYLPHLVSQNLKYLYKKTDSAIKPISLWLVTDVDTRKGRLMLQNALKFLKGSSHTRVTIIHHPSHPFDTKGHVSPNSLWIMKACLQAAIETQDMNVAKLILNKMSKDRGEITSIKQAVAEFSVSGMDVAQFTTKAQSYLDSFASSEVPDSPDGSHGHRLFRLHASFARNTLMASPGESLIVANGKVVRLLSNPDSIFSPSDFSLTEKFIYNAVSKDLATKIEEVADDLGEFRINDLVMKLSGALLWAKNDARRTDFKIKHEKLGCFSSPKHKATSVSEDKRGPTFEFMAVLDPLSRDAQLLSQVLLVLNDVVDADIKVCFNCKSQLSEAPLKSYYRYVLKPEVQYPTKAADDDVTFEGGADVTTPTKDPYPVPSSARFGNPPHNSLFTLNMYTPENWMIQSIRTPYDLDNIHLSEIPTDVYATFELEYLLLEGHCFDKTSDKPPRGLQFTLGPAYNPLMTDTLVMANLGYFQMKAHPGPFVLHLRAGKSSEIYRVVSHQNTDSISSDSQDIIVVLDSFLSKTIHVKVTKKQDKLDQDLLSESEAPPGKARDSDSEDYFDLDDADEEDDDDDLERDDGETDQALKTAKREKKQAKKMSNETSGGAGGETNKTLATINIFSVASGHLYERFLKLMMLSVLKHTKSPVKFWFLKNYLSPTFKEFIPHMAKEYKFDYELVQYKWPKWLHQQTEKQRIIWGYKILFLDVLFPLDVDKIIYVDADQIVRTDMKELVDFDLGGAPYGYTPFCSSRKEMDGFRFWKSGYWATHLGPRKYHISALYVVDLKKFRLIAAGDRLRGQYQGLSQDPNSLSNLDQDLPNNMIHQVMIKSLPQEWLWCETWCDDESKAKAKTIDLCNNPQTKEPKLHSAMRIIPEWKDYDSEIKNFTEKISSLKNPPVVRTDKTDDNVPTLKHDGSEL